MPYTPKAVAPVDTVVKDAGLSIIVFGVGGSGKSWFGINTADVAEPLYLLNFDRTVDHLLKRYPGKEYYYEKFVPDDKASALQDLAKVMDVVSYAVRHGQGTFVIDNVAALWALVCKAYLPEKDKVLPRDYGNANDWMRELCLTLEDSKLFSIFTAPASELWVGAQSNSGLYVPDMWKHLEFHTVATLYLFVEGEITAVPPVPKENSLLGSYKALIVKSKLNPTTQGLIVDNPTLGELWPLIR